MHKAYSLYAKYFLLKEETRNTPNIKLLLNVQLEEV